MPASHLARGTHRVQDLLKEHQQPRRSQQGGAAKPVHPEPALYVMDRSKSGNTYKCNC
jgi:hypothetical protein